MKKLSNLNNLSLLALALLVTFGACSSVNNDVEAISNEDVDLAAHIVTTSIADDESGIPQPESTALITHEVFKTDCSVNLSK